jgi:hypothetical protein
MAARFSQWESKNSRLLYLPWIVSAAVVVYLFIGGFWPGLLARAIRSSVAENLAIIACCIVFLVVLCGSLAYAHARGYGKSGTAAYLCSCVWMGFFFLLLGQLMVRVSTDRSSKSLAEKSLSFLTPDSQLVIYNTYVPGLPFYLNVDRPIWLVAPEEKETWMGSPYVANQMQYSASGHGKVFFTFDDFAQAWKKMKQPPLVFAKAKHVSLLEGQVGEATRELARANEYVLVSKSRRPGPASELSARKSEAASSSDEVMAKGMK